MLRKLAIQNLQKIKKFFVSICHRCYCGLAIEAHTHASPTLGELSVSKSVQKSHDQESDHNDQKSSFSRPPASISCKGK